MRPLAALALLLLMSAGAAAVLPGLRGDAGQAQPGMATAAARAGHAGGAAGDAPYVRDDVHAWSSPAGQVPDPDAPLREFDHVTIRGDRGLAELAARGVLSGNGTRADPFVLQGVRVDHDLSIADTAAYLVLRDGIVGGKLKLNWNGQHVHVHHMRIADLRVNENVKRTGDDTGGLLEDNVIAFIGQMRHFAGVFQANQVGPRPRDVATQFLGDNGIDVVQDGEVWNLDGFDLADVHDNDVQGMVDIKLHGHDHGDCLACLGHRHAGADAMHDHTQRWTSLDFHDNRIHAEQGDALLYRDTPHAQDDRTAASETNPRLELPHVHHTLIRLEDNTLHGPLEVKVFGSRDERHLNGSEGWLDVVGNTIQLPSRPGPLPSDGATWGMSLHDARGVHLDLRGNSIAWVQQDETAVDPLLPARGDAGRIGIVLKGWQGSDLAIVGNSVQGAHTGLQARDFPAGTTWRLEGNSFRGDVPVDYDGSVESEPG